MEKQGIARRAAAALASPATLPLAFLVLAVGVRVAVTSDAGGFFNTDAAFIAATGRDILESGLSATDPLSMHERLSYVCQQWLTCVIAALCWLAGGRAGAAALFGALFAAATMCVWGLVRKRGRLGVRAATSVALLFFLGPAFLPSPPRTSYGALALSVGRSAAFDVAALCLGWACAESYLERSAASRARAWLALAPVPLFALLYVNVHGALWPLSFAVPAAAILDARGGAREKLALAACCALSALTCLANPYGADMLAYSLVSLGSEAYSAAGIQELQPAAASNPICLLAMASPLLFGWLRRRQPGKCGDAALRLPRGRSIRWAVRFEDVLLAVFWVAGMMCARNCLYLYAVLSVMLGRALLAADDKAASRKQVAPKTAALLNLAVCVAAAGSLLTAGDSLAQTQESDEEAQIGQALEALADEGVGQGSAVFCHPNWGGVVELDGYRAFMDPRFEVFCPEFNGGSNILGDFEQAWSGREPLSEMLSHYCFDGAVTDKAQDAWWTEGQMEAAGFEKVYENEGFAAWVFSGAGD